MTEPASRSLIETGWTLSVGEADAAAWTCTVGNAKVN